MHGKEVTWHLARSDEGPHTHSDLNDFALRNESAGEEAIIRQVTLLATNPRASVTSARLTMVT